MKNCVSYIKSVFLTNNILIFNTDSNIKSDIFMIYTYEQNIIIKQICVSNGDILILNEMGGLSLLLLNKYNFYIPFELYIDSRIKSIYSCKYCFMTRISGW